MKSNKPKSQNISLWTVDSSPKVKPSTLMAPEWLFINHVNAFLSFVLNVWFYLLH